MARKPRCVVPEVAHHVTVRGVDRCQVFYSHADRETYLNLVADHLPDARVRILAWCLMTNHVHWLVVPEQPDSLHVLFRRVQGRYAQYLNARRGRTGHLWERRFFSCPVEWAGEEIVLRYVERNPVRALMVEAPEAYSWSSARVHLAGPQAERIRLLDWNDWEMRGGAEGWRELWRAPVDECETVRIRRATYAGQPLGTADFQAELEQRFGRQWKGRGRPARKSVEMEKGTLSMGTIS